MKKSKFVKTLVSMTLVIACVLSSVACGGSSKVDDSDGKTVLAIGNRDRGLGHAWLDAVAAEFEKEYANYQGADGKVGVMVEITNKLNEFDPASLQGNLPYNGFDVYVVDELNYTTLQSTMYEGNSVLLDLTDVMTEKYYDDQGNLVVSGGTKSIADRMVKDYEKYYNLGTETQPSYFALPFVASPGGGIYDADCFDENRLYFKANGNIGASQEDIDNGNCGKGPDGELGTYDDGMPATWEQFKKLMNQMCQASIYPFVWAGNYTYQREAFFASIYANYEGANNYNLLYTLNGTDSNIGEITQKNGYKLAGQEGRLAAIRAVKDIMSDQRNYSPKAMTPSTTHTLAEMYYIQSINQSERIAMFMEYGYWENEARDYFDDMGAKNSAFGYGKRNFKLLPIPNFDGTVLATAEENGGTEIVSTQSDNKQVLIMDNSTNSSIFASAQTKVPDLAKEFIKFIHSRSMLVKTTQVGAYLRPFEYKFTADELEGCTKFCQNVITIRDDKNTDIVWGCVTRGNTIESYSVFSKDWFSNNPFDKFYNEQNFSVISYLKSMNNKFSQSQWPIK